MKLPVTAKIKTPGGVTKNITFDVYSEDFKLFEGFVGYPTRFMYDYYLAYCTDLYDMGGEEIKGSIISDAKIIY